MPYRPVLALLLCLAAPALAQDEDPHALATSRLRACILSGSADVQGMTYQAALVSVRSLCLPQIKTLYALSDSDIAAANPDADAARLETLQKEARRRIDYDVAAAVAQMTGLQP